VIKTTGAEWKAFLHDDAYWGEWAFEDQCYIVNGNSLGMDAHEDTFADTDAVKVDGGYVWDQAEGSEKTSPLSAFFSKWRKQQTTEFLSVEVPKEKADAVRAAIVAAGGKVK
jgi:hypothetical protein